MGTIHKENNRAEYLLMRDVILEYHPKMKKYSKNVKKAFLEQAASGTQNVAMYLEQVVSAVGNIAQSNKQGEDHADGSDTKFASLCYYSNGKYFSHRGHISNLKNKNGALRVALYIEHEDKIRFYFLPPRMWKRITAYKGNIIHLSYNPSTRKVSRFSQHEVSFTDMCKMRAA